MPAHLGFGDILVFERFDNHITGLAHHQLFVMRSLGLPQPSSILHLLDHIIESIDEIDDEEDDEDEACYG